MQTRFLLTILFLTVLSLLAFGGTYRVIVPYVVADYMGWNTSFAVVNTNSATVSVSYNMFYSCGVPVSAPLTFLLEPNESFMFYPANFGFSGVVGWAKFEAGGEIFVDKLLIYNDFVYGQTYIAKP